MTVLQVLSTIAILAITVIAPASAGAVAIGAQQVGYLVSLAYLFATVASLVSGSIVAFFGGERTVIVQTLLIAFAMLLSVTGMLWGLVAAAVCLGAAYGVNNTAASVLLLGHLPKARYSLAYSIKQAGVPFGAFCASVGLASLFLLGLPWWTGLVLIAGASVVFAIAFSVQFPGSRPARVLRLRDIPAQLWRSQVHILSESRTRCLGIIGMLYTASQLSVISYGLTLLLADDWSLRDAALIAGAVQLAGAVGRIWWGQVADRVGIFPVFALLGLVSAILMLVVGGDVSGTVKAIAFISLGFHISGWNGVYISACSKTAPADDAAGHIGGLVAYTFLGTVLGPSLFAALYSYNADVMLTFALAGLPPLAGSCCALYAWSTTRAIA